MNTIQQQKAAKEFAAHWEGKGYEKGESQIFILRGEKTYTITGQEVK